MRVLMVCLGNICRSPTAEAVMRAKLGAAGLGADVTVDSAGTHGWHEGAPPDRRAIAHGARRGYALHSLRSRALRDADFERFDLLLAMDGENLAELESRCPPEHLAKLGRLAGFARRFEVEDVPDPYYGGAAEFEYVLDLLEDACDGLLAHLAARLADDRSGG